MQTHEMHFVPTKKPKRYVYFRIDSTARLNKQLVHNFKENVHWLIKFLAGAWRWPYVARRPPRAPGRQTADLIIIAE